MVGHSMLLLSYVYKKKVKSNIVKSSFNREIAKLSVEVTMNIWKYWAVTESKWMTQRNLQGGHGCHKYHVQKNHKIISQVAFLVIYAAVRGFYSISVMSFKGTIRREWGRRTVDCSLITNIIYQYIFNENTLFFMDHRHIRQKFPLVYSCDVLAQYFHQYNL